MSEDDSDTQPDLSSGHSAATDPRGTVLASERPDSWYPTGIPSPRSTHELSPEERAYHRQVFGVTYRERYGEPAEPAGTCVTFCIDPGQKRKGIRCPACYQAVEIRPFDDSGIEPGRTRAERFAAWIGGWAGAFADAMLFPFRVGRAHTEAVIRDILQETLAAELSAEAGALSDMLQVLEGIELELRAIRNAAEAAGGRADRA